MKKSPSENLPEPSHPFARWCAGVAIACWALGVQYFPEPWNKLGAILSPGIGYLFGHALDWVISSIGHVISERKKRTLKSKLDGLCREREKLTQYGSNSEMIAVFNAEIKFCEETILRLIKIETAEKKGR